MRLIHGDCREILPTLPAASVDCVITDPPYPCIERSYGYWTEAEWFAMMRAVVPECMRVLKPIGSAVFILQPNSERNGRMRTWLWEFMLWVGQDYGVVQDVYWWNTSAMPLGGACIDGLLRPSLKSCVWIGSAECYRNQNAVLLDESTKQQESRIKGDLDDVEAPSRRRSATEGMRDNMRRLRTVAESRGGVTPFNILPFGSGSSAQAGSFGHGAGTPPALCRWWIHYICPLGGTVLDPFSGSGTIPLVSLSEGRHAIGIEKNADYVKIAENRLDAELAKHPLFVSQRPREES